MYNETFRSITSVMEALVIMIERKKMKREKLRGGLKNPQITKACFCIIVFRFDRVHERYDPYKSSWWYTTRKRLEKIPIALLRKIRAHELSCS